MIEKWGKGRPNRAKDWRHLDERVMSKIGRITGWNPELLEMEEGCQRDCWKNFALTRLELKKRRS